MTAAFKVEFSWLFAYGLSLEKDISEKHSSRASLLAIDVVGKVGSQVNPEFSLSPLNRNNNSLLPG